ncbi:LysR family transcriptional regulator [Caldimonas brevitalea]|uniref:LysR:LysR substrate binding domain n=1 Tax=Caldimonas brevitalea TaxID=413882 RepID=A8KCJ5_9BURK|nr:LysR family transcriptional regulator [Caldimonas brevitalea]AKJ29074.1 transcriptional regulator, LysR family [Caldimonas brevitalea]CAL80827.1 LysR:LysR substrate binding domain [Caldimonas brevitalea]
MDKLHALSVFTKVVDTGSFSRAASALGLTSAALSRTLAGLEAELGARLLQRTTRRLALTVAGEIYLDRARRILREVDEADAAVAAMAAEPRGKLRLVGPSAFLVYEVARRLPAFTERYPGVSLEVTPRGYGLDVDSRYDVSIEIAKEDSRLQDDLAVRQLVQTHLIPCASPSYLRRTGPVAHPRELLERDCLVADVPGVPQVWRFERDNEAIELEPRIALQARHGESLLAAALAGMGIASLPTFMVRHALQRGALVRLLPEWRTTPYTLYAAMPDHGPNPGSTQAFVHFLVTSFGGRPDDPWLVACTTPPARIDPSTGQGRRATHVGPAELAGRPALLSLSADV